LLTLAAGWLHARPLAGPPEARTFDLPVSQIMDLDGRVVRLDTRTGAMDLLRGDATFAGNSAYWVRRVPGVGDGTSGVLTVQTIESGEHSAFLVDALEGTTWILRWRGNENGQWSKLETK
jgi:hypothetical protein